jgi:hypothetical protein
MQRHLVLMTCAAAWLFLGGPVAGQERFGEPSPMDPRPVDPTLDPRPVEPRPVEPRLDPRPLEPRPVEPRTPDVRPPEARSSDAHPTNAMSLIAQAIAELTDPPALGGRTNVDLGKRWGADLSQIRKSTALLQDALDRARGSNAPSPAVRKLEEALSYARTGQHKEARLNAQGALRHLCNQAGNQPAEACDMKKAPKYGAYVAP